MASHFTSVIGSSKAASEIRAFGRLAASVDAPVLITGESGTGKGILAAAIHRASRRARHPFIAVNCAGIAETLFESEFFGHSRGAFTGAVQQHRGLFEQAHRGSLFLDEIGELSTGHQAKLLTAIEDGEFRRVGAETCVSVDARIVAATGVNLREAIARGEFRLDLYHRLLVLAFRMPPLRDRRDDCLVLAGHFLDLSAQRHGRPVRTLDPRTEDRIRKCDWPGNVRQLAHAIEAAVLVCDGDVLLPHHLPDHIMASHDDNAARYSFFGDRSDERLHILNALRRSHGNKTRAARALGMARNTLRARIAELEIECAADADPVRSSYVHAGRQRVD